MPSPLTSSFASAAANTSQEGAANRRVEGNGNNDWSRSRANGATQTFRRPSVATTTSHIRDGSQNVQLTPSSNSGVYLPPHMNSNNSSSLLRNGAAYESRFNKVQLLDIYRFQRESGSLDRGLSELFLGDWNPAEQRDGTPSGWGRREDSKDVNAGPEVCWAHQVEAPPLGLLDLNDEEKELFASSVNSLLKPPQAAAKDGAAVATIGGRKTSISTQLGSLGTNTPNSAKPGTRRRDTGDSFGGNGPLSPTGAGGKFFRDETSATAPLARRRTDLKDDINGPDREPEITPQSRKIDLDSPFNSLKRSTTGPLSASLNAPASPWGSGPSSGALGTMGGFGNFAAGPSSTSQDQTEKRPGFGSARGGSRFKDLLAKSSAEDAPSIKEKGSTASLERLLETEGEDQQSRQQESFRTRPARSETNPYGENISRGGSAALGHNPDPGAATSALDQLGFSSFGMPSNDFMHQAQQHGHMHQTPNARARGNEPMSPTNTNPYQSPEGDRQTPEDGNDNDLDLQHSGTLGFNSATEEVRNVPFGSIRRGLPPNIEERGPNQGTSLGRGFGSLGGLGPTSAWPTSGFGTGTPNKERAPFSGSFGDQFFGAMGDLQSPGLGGIGGNSLFGSPGLGTSNINARSSKLGPLFPPAMQEQMRGDKNRTDASDDTSDRFQNEVEPRTMANGPFESSARFGLRESSSFDQGQNLSQFPRGSEDVVASMEGSGAFPQTSIAGSAHIPITSPGFAQGVAHTADAGPPAGQGLSQSEGSSSSNQLPAAQQRQMVMPDRMRWIYRDPSGNMQGPWSGLEMHDWFKAGFFTAELQVKKLEDADYEPLAQLVRRIGNSREPFLVPQIGVPHGPAVSSPGNQWAGPAPTVPVGSAPPPTGSAQPPFASSFPSFGTTLTAEQQNALERRKQEEQFLMARQKEHLAQQQVAMKMQLQGGPHGIHSLQHHSSAHSLHSQPSFGSITSPLGGYQPSTMQNPIQAPQNLPGFFDSPIRHGPTSNMGQSPPGSELRGIREEDLSSLAERMSMNQRAPNSFGPGLIGTQPSETGPSQQQITAMLQDRARLQLDQQQADMRGQGGGYQDQGERLREFHNLRAQADSLYQGPHSGEPSQQPPIGAPMRHFPEDTLKQSQGQPVSREDQQASSLTQQVKEAASAQQHARHEAPWVHPGMALDSQVLPPQSVTPLPAPAAQRNRQNVAEALAAESRSQAHTPVETQSTSLAPWAEKTQEGPKGPSLKEIQEAEALKAAQQEEIVAAARRAQAEEERLVLPGPSAPGLPSSANWATSGSPATPTTPGTSVWTKTTGGKPTVAAPASGAKKTLAQIQKEEEFRKQRHAAASNTQKANVPSVTAGGTRYADLAGKMSPATPVGPPGAWTTVGSSGKAKTPSTAIATPTGVARTSSTVAPTLTTATRLRPATQTTRSALSMANQTKANDDFTKWAKSALGGKLNSDVKVDEFVQTLLLLPSETEILAEAVYGSSPTIDGRQFAVEFLRRRKLAEKGIVDPSANGTSTTSTEAKSGGGWSEVAKKGPAATKEESNTAFKVVAAKKKGKK